MSFRLGMTGRHVRKTYRNLLVHDRNFVHKDYSQHLYNTFTDYIPCPTRFLFLWYISQSSQYSYKHRVGLS